MSLNLKCFSDLISLTQIKSYSRDFEISINKIDQIKKFSSFECTLFMYPFDRSLSADSFSFLPYEEYVNDVNLGKRSMYRKTEPVGDNLFGLILGLAIFLFFWIFNRTEIFSVEAIVSIFAAYAIGKEFWLDFDSGLTTLTQKWKLSWRDSSHYYIKQDFGSIQRFWKVARIKKYKIDTLLAHKLDFINSSNSKALELLFRKKELRSTNENSLNLAILSFDNNLEKLDSKNNFMFGVKLVFTKNRILWKSNLELFQALNKNELGAVDKNNEWNANKVLVRRTLNIGRIKFYRKTYLEKDISLINNI